VVLSSVGFSLRGLDFSTAQNGKQAEACSTGTQEELVIEPVATDRGPKAIGPYSQAVKANGFVFLSGQVALDPNTQQVIEGDVVRQTERVLENLKAIVEAAGSSLQHAVKTTVFLADMNDFAAMNEVYGRYFGAHRPARSTVEVSRLPKDVRVEIDLIALL
jgi:2-iminobutanoate/2-iminopropanoate deaminase